MYCGKQAYNNELFSHKSLKDFVTVECVEAMSLWLYMFDEKWVRIATSLMQVYCHCAVSSLNECWLEHAEGGYLGLLYLHTLLGELNTTALVFSFGT